MGKSRISKIVGIISKQVAEQYQLYEYEGREIVQSLDLYAHIQKHIPEFESIDSFHNTMANISDIIKEPYFVYFDSKRNSLLYFKAIDENVCVVVKLTLRKNKDIYISTIYPINPQKIQRYIENSYICKE